MPTGPAETDARPRAEGVAGGLLTAITTEQVGWDGHQRGPCACAAPAVVADALSTVADRGCAQCASRSADDVRRVGCCIGHT
jgi:hypothetical protein